MISSLKHGSGVGKLQSCRCVRVCVRAHAGACVHFWVGGLHVGKNDVCVCAFVLLFACLVNDCCR